MIYFKFDARFDFVESETLRTLADLADVWMAVFPAISFYITSGTDSATAHAAAAVAGDFHVQGKAFDFRTHQIPHDQMPKLEHLFRDFMTSHPGWQLLLENPGKPIEHGHAEHDGLLH